MNAQHNSSNTLAIVGLVIGIISLVFSLIPCLGTFAFIPGIVGLVLGVIALLQAKDNGHPKGMAISVVVVSILACLISVFQIFFFSNAASKLKTERKEYTDCQVLKEDLTVSLKELKAVTKDIDKGNSPLENMKKVTQLGFTIDHIKKESVRLECDIDFENMESAIEESESTSENPTDKKDDRSQTEESNDEE
ncbi:MAG: DUF4190 domain-containing protein [Saprospiraceae bacterium]|nr:DUF4190 domain-containing protein [Saprospiraceae bacterium]